jgi:hypothetical protein
LGPVAPSRLVFAAEMAATALMGRLVYWGEADMAYIPRE